MDAQLLNTASEYFQHRCEVSLEALLAPIETARPTGESVRHNGVYRAIDGARREDDPTLPQGPWEHELKRADWDAVSAHAVAALRDRSKDLQIAVWLLEAEIHRAGFEGIAPCLVLIRELCERYWDDLYPAMEDGDLEYRTNPVRWANEKLLPALRQVPVTAERGGERALGWADRDRALRNQQIASVQGAMPEDEQPSLSPADFEAALLASPAGLLQARARELDLALEALHALAASLRARCADEAPPLTALEDLLEQVRTLLRGQLRNRGIVDEPPAQAACGDAQALPADEPASMPALDVACPLRSRAEAYARLAEIAEYLRRIEPHSPVPYLIGQAVDWGALDSRALYRELFLEYQGQLSIFEMMGLNQGEGAERSAES